MDESPPDWDALLEAYMSGSLSEEERGLFMHCLESSEEARSELAATVGTERLLRALGSKPVPVADIMYAVLKDSPTPEGTAPVPVAPATPGAKTAPAWWPAAAGVVGLLAIGWLVMTQVNKPPAVEPAAPEVVVAPKLPDPVAPPVVDPPVASPAASTPAPQVGPPTIVPEAAFQAFPLSPPEVVGLPDPTGDGSDELGFVAPPAVPETLDPTPILVEGAPAPPTLITKLTVGSDAAPNDLSRLLAFVAEKHRLKSAPQSIALAELQDDPTDLPVLYLSTHYHFVFTPEQRALLRRYILNGGMLVLNAGAGSVPARDSARRELEKILPELPLQALGADDPLYHAYYDLAEPPVLEGVSISCRTAVIVATEGLALKWQARDPAALQFGVNLISYATAIRAWAKRSAHTRAYVAPGQGVGDRLYIAQVKHAGEWRTRYTGLPNLLHTYNQRTDVPVQFDIKSMGLGENEIYNHPMLYLTGHAPLRLRANEIVALRKYLQNGGFLLAEACCGREGFDQSFRALMRQLFPKQPLEAIPSDAVLYQSPHQIDVLGVTQKLAARAGSMVIKPQLEGIRFGENYGVIYSSYGMAGAWEMAQSPYADGYQDPDTLKLGQNILHYVITQ